MVNVLPVWFPTNRQTYIAPYVRRACLPRSPNEEVTPPRREGKRADPSFGWLQRESKSKTLGHFRGLLGPPVVPFSPLLWAEGSPTKIDDRKKKRGTLILTSLLDLARLAFIELSLVWCQRASSMGGAGSAREIGLFPLQTYGCTRPSEKGHCLSLSSLDAKPPDAAIQWISKRS